MNDTTAPAPRRDASRTKAIVAIAAGAVLLLGGGTTLAYWSTQQSLDAGTVTSGDLDLTIAAAAPAWTLTPEGGAAAPVADITTVRIVPGDTVTFTQTAELTLVGDNLHAELEAVLDGATLPAGVTAPTPVVTVAGGDPADLTVADDGATATVTLTYTFPASTANRDLVNSAFDFGDVDLTLTQVAP
ncbi:alternate-type signal peptide domain-containing protein [Microbacterium sp. NPDC055903]